MLKRFSISSACIAFIVFCLPAFSLAQTAASTTKIPWSLTVVIMDGTDRVQKAEIPVKEAVEFIEANSRFVFDVTYVTTASPHRYTSYRSGNKRNKDRTRGELVHYMLGWDVPQAVIRSLPVSSSYLFLYKLHGRKPAMAGSALGLDYGFMKGGKRRPWATVPTDMHWFINVPKQGFKSWAAQVLTHEIINTIQAKLEAAPYRCGQLKGKPGSHANIHESERLKGITDRCYAKLGRNAD